MRLVVVVSYCRHWWYTAVHEHTQTLLIPYKLCSDFRDEGADILVMARTDARAGLGIEEALERCREFRKIGADITFLAGHKSVEDLRQNCREVDGPKVANMVEV